MNLSRRLEGSRPRGPSVVLTVRGTRAVSNRSRETRSLCHDYALTTMLSPTRCRRSTPRPAFSERAQARPSFPVADFGPHLAAQLDPARATKMRRAERCSRKSGCALTTRVRKSRDVSQLSDGLTASCWRLMSVFFSFESGITYNFRMNGGQTWNAKLCAGVEGGHNAISSQQTNKSFRRIWRTCWQRPESGRLLGCSGGFAVWGFLRAIWRHRRVP
jgi:hypothetical protein